MAPAGGDSGAVKLTRLMGTVDRKGLDRIALLSLWLNGNGRPEGRMFCPGSGAALWLGGGAAFRGRINDTLESMVLSML